MTDLIVAVVLLAMTVTVLVPGHVRRERDEGPLSRRAVHRLDDDRLPDGESKGGSA